MFVVDGDWADLGPGTARLEAFHVGQILKTAGAAFVSYQVAPGQYVHAQSIEFRRVHDEFIVEVVIPIDEQQWRAAS